MQSYVHGYSEREALRLTDQADTLANLLHEGTGYPPGSTVLECGCGTGAQTVHLAARSPQADFVCIDLSSDSLDIAREKIQRRGMTRVTFKQADLYDPCFAGDAFDHAFVCFVLEHLPDPARALAAIRRVIKPGGSLTVIEGDHGSWFCHPETPEARRAVDCLIRIQSGLNGDALIGRKLYPLLRAAGFGSVRVEPRMVYVDGSRPDLIEGFSKNTFIAMVAAVEEQVAAQRLMEPADWRKGIDDLYRAAREDGTFCYTFFKAVAIKKE